MATKMSSKTDKKNLEKCNKKLENATKTYEKAQNGLLGGGCYAYEFDHHLGTFQLQL